MLKHWEDKTSHTKMFTSWNFYTFWTKSWQQSRSSPLRWWWKSQWGAPLCPPRFPPCRSASSCCPWWFCQRLECRNKSWQSVAQSCARSLERKWRTKTVFLAWCLVSFNRIERKCRLLCEVVLVSLVLSHNAGETGPLPVWRSLQAGLAHVGEDALAGGETLRHGHSLHTPQSWLVTGGNLHSHSVIRQEPGGITPYPLHFFRREK